MIEHITLPTKSLSRSKEFYLAALKPLRYEVVVEFPGVVGMGVDGKTDFWLVTRRKECEPTHFAFSARTHDEVDEFYKAALAAGGKDNGAPGIRPEYSKHYYGAFVIDCDGNNVEAVCNKAEESSF